MEARAAILVIGWSVWPTSGGPLVRSGPGSGFGASRQSWGLGILSSFSSSLSGFRMPRVGFLAEITGLKP